MPNGHGGIPRFGVPFFLAIAEFLALPAAHAIWVKVVCIVLAVLFGWRLAFHIHMWGVTEYGGAYEPEAAKSRAKRKYLIAAVAYSAIAVAVAALFAFKR